MKLFLILNGNTNFTHLVEGPEGSQQTLCKKLVVTIPRTRCMDREGIRVFQPGKKDCLPCWQAAKRMASAESAK